VYTATAMVLVTGILLMYTNRPVGWDIVYVGVLITGFAPLTFGWAPFIIGASYAFVASVIALEHMQTENLIDWVVAVLSAVAIGGMLLGQRLQMIRVLADAEFAREQLVETDILTGLFNRRGIYSRVETVWAGAMRRGEAVNIAFIDIVGLKHANDAHGHDLGDQIIVEVANAIRESVRREDLVARWGGDEFVVLAKGDLTATEDLQQRILSNMRMRDAAFADRWRSDVTVGSASAQPDEMGFQELLQRADSNMYARRQHPHP
jgi:diguanylate cyclase (GGDEF)-like protein